MLEEVVIRTHRKASLKPLLESAIQREIRSLEVGIRRTRERLAQFEDTYRMTSAEFERRLVSREIEETPDFTDWRMEMGMLHLLEEQTKALREAEVDA